MCVGDCKNVEENWCQLKTLINATLFCPCFRREKLDKMILCSLAVLIWLFNLHLRIDHVQHTWADSLTLIFKAFLLLCASIFHKSRFSLISTSDFLQRIGSHVDCIIFLSPVKYERFTVIVRRYRMLSYGSC